MRAVDVSVLPAAAPADAEPSEARAMALELSRTTFGLAGLLLFVVLMGVVLEGVTDRVSLVAAVPLCVLAGIGAGECWHRLTAYLTGEGR